LFGFAIFLFGFPTFLFGFPTFLFGYAIFLFGFARFHNLRSTIQTKNSFCLHLRLFYLDFRFSHFFRMRPIFILLRLTTSRIIGLGSNMVNQPSNLGKNSLPRTSGRLGHRTSIHAIFFLWGYLKQKVYNPLPKNIGGSKILLDERNRKHFGSNVKKKLF
jgi:hypothetical protein